MTEQEKKKLEEMSEYAPIKDQKEEALAAAKAIVIDTSELDPIDVINMMGGQWLRSTPQYTPIKSDGSSGKGKGKGRGKGKVKNSESRDSEHSECTEEDIVHDAAASGGSVPSGGSGPSGGSQKKGEETVYLVSVKDTYEVKSLGNYQPLEIEGAVEYCQQKKYIPKSDDVKIRKENKKPIVRVKTPGKNISEIKNVENIRIVTEYMHKLLPTDYDTLTSEDSTISDLNGTFRSAREEFCANLQSSREEATAIVQDYQISKTFNLAVKQIDNVKKSLNFDTGSESNSTQRRKQKTLMKLSSSSQDKLSTYLFCCRL